MLASPAPTCCLQVRLYKEHSKEVTDLCFDGPAEYLASCSADGSAAVSDGRARIAGQALTLQGRALLCPPLVEHFTMQQCLVLLPYAAVQTGG